MINEKSEVKKLVSSLIVFFQQDENETIVDLLRKAQASLTEVAFDTYTGITRFSLVLDLEIADYRSIREMVKTISKKILDASQLFLQHIRDEELVEVCIKPVLKEHINWQAIASQTTKAEFLKIIERIREIMIKTATGVYQIATVNEEYIELYKRIDGWLDRISLHNPNEHNTIWEWYRRWKQSDLGTYALRREFIANMYRNLESIISSEAKSLETEIEPTGWERVDRTIGEMRISLSNAKNEEQYQTIGLLGREALMSIGQQVFDKEKHISEDGVGIKDGDIKGMLDAYLGHKLQGSPNERPRKYAKASVDLANQLTHDRTASRRDAEMCLTSLVAVANLIRIIDSSDREERETTILDDIPF